MPASFGCAIAQLSWKVMAGGFWMIISYQLKYITYRMRRTAMPVLVG